MRCKSIIITVLLALAVIAPTFSRSLPVGIPILIDLSHGQSYNGIDIMMKVVPEAEWYILVSSEEDIEALPDSVKYLATSILVGDFSTIDLEKLLIAMVIIGQPQSPLKPEEVTALATWIKSTSDKVPLRVLWIATDSDYPAQGSEQAQETGNILLEAIGARVRFDYVSIEDTVSNAGGAGYRVVAIVNPDPEVAVLGYAAEKVLFHGPGPIAWVDDNGNWHKLTKDDKPDNVYIVATTTENSLVKENQGPPQGREGNIYTPKDSGTVITLMAIEKIPVDGAENIVIVSGETPYGGYQPGVSWKYYDKVLDGPRFFRNVVLWSTEYMGELKEYASIASTIKTVESSVETVNTQIQDVSTQVESVVSAISAVNSYAMGGLGLGVLALIIALVAVVLASKKK